MTEVAQDDSLNIFYLINSLHVYKQEHTRDVFYVCRKVDLMKTMKVNAYIMHIVGKIDLLSIHAT